MADKFTQLAKVLSERNMSAVDQKIAGIEAEKEQVTSAFDQQLSQLKAVRSSQKMVKEQVRAQEKREKLEKDLIKAMVDSGELGNMAVGGKMVDEFAGVNIAPDAQGLPIVDGIM